MAEGDGYRLVPMQGFGGLVLRDGPDAVGISEAVDLLNVEFSERGAVRQRDGYGPLTTHELTNRADSITPFYKSDGTRRLIVGNGNRLTAIGTDGAVTGSESTAPTASPHFFTRFGSPSVEGVYIANGTDQIRRYDTAGGFTAPAGLSGQTGRFLCVQSPDNRLVVARESGTTAGNNPSSVNFSNAGDPETFSASNYVDIRPGDGEAIMGVCTWRELTFVFKESYFAVFYGNSTVGSTTTFNYRVVDGGVGLASSRALCVAEDAVYFLGRRGVYRTTGGPAQLVSEPLEPFFHGRAPSVYYQSSTLAHGSITASAMWTFQDRIYVAVPTGAATTNDRILVFDSQGNWWSMYDIAASCGTTFRVSSQEEMVFGYAAGPKMLGRHSTAYNSDRPATGVTNLLTNPSFEVDAAGWAGTNAAIARSTTVADNGVASLRITADGAGSPVAQTSPRVTVTVGQSYAASARFRAAVTPRAARIDLRWYDGGGGYLSEVRSGTVLTETDGWVFASVIGVAPASTATVEVMVRAHEAVVPASEVHYVDSVILANDTEVPDYFDGSTGDGYWTGTAHASTSVELAATAIESRWRSGWQDFSTPQEKTIRESQVWGSGTCTVTLTSNFREAGGLSEVVEFTSSDVQWDDGTRWDQGAKWGPTGTIREHLVRKALPGAVFSTQFSNTTLNQGFVIHRLSHHLREAREPNVVAA